MRIAHPRGHLRTGGVDHIACARTRGRNISGGTGCCPRAKYPAPGQQMLAQQAVAPYRIRVGDTLGIRFYKTPELNVDVPVRSDGKISLSPVGDVQAAGLAPEDLGKVLSQLYST